jgi:hypothetical protein
VAKRKDKKGKPARKPKKAPATAKGDKNTGVSLEKAVARVQQMLDPNSTVTHNEWLVDQTGNSRQYDVVIRGFFAGQPLLGVAECKDHADRKGPAEVEAFARKCENLGANLRIIFSRMGFTEQGLRQARFEHIVCLSLLPNDPQQGGYPFEAIGYAKFWRWVSMDMALFPREPSVVLPSFEAQDVRYQASPVAAWFLKEVITTYKNHYSTEPVSVTLTFDQPRLIEIAGNPFEIACVAFCGTRTFSLRRKVLRLLGDGVYNWLDAKLQVPKGGQIAAGPFDGCFQDWEEFAGPIPEKPNGLFVLVLEGHDNQFKPAGEIIDLTVL